MTSLLPCPFCGSRAVMSKHQYRGTGASGMETAEPYVECVNGCVAMKPVRCDDWPSGRSLGLPTQKQAIKIAAARWNQRV